MDGLTGFVSRHLVGAGIRLVHVDVVRPISSIGRVLRRRADDPDA
jgi:hypothetical protein